MASSIAPASWALPLQTGGGGAVAAGPSCRVLLAVTAPRSAASLRRARVLVAPPRCAALEGAGGEEEGAKVEEEAGNKSCERKKRARGRPVWRRILFASKKTRSIIMLNALSVIYGVRIFLLSCS
jgi:hypothetical protein